MRRFWRRRSHDPDPLVCREFVQLVSDYLEDLLPERERRRFEAHLAECDGCAGYLDDVARVVGSLNEELGVKDVTWLSPAGEEMAVEQWTDGNARCFGMLLDGRAQLMHLHGQHKAAVRLQQPAQGRVGEWTVAEVRPQGQDHLDGSVRLARRRGQ